MRSLRFGVWLPALVAFALLVLAWQLAAVNAPPSTMATVPATLAELGQRPGLFWSNAVVTLQELAVGVSVSFTVAFVLAVVMCQVKLVERALMPLAVVLNVTPVIAYAYGLVIVLGYGIGPRYVVTGIIVFFPFLVNSLIGLRSVDAQALELLRTLNASRWEVLWRLRLPSSLPFLFAAARICLPLAVVGATVAEFTTSGSSKGLGSLVATGNSGIVLNGTAQVFAAILLLAGLGLLLTLAVTILERRLLTWHPSRAAAR